MFSMFSMFHLALASLVCFVFTCCMSGSGFGTETGWTQFLWPVRLCRWVIVSDVSEDRFFDREGALGTSRNIASSTQGKTWVISFGKIHPDMLLHFKKYSCFLQSSITICLLCTVFNNCYTFRHFL